VAVAGAGLLLSSANFASGDTGTMLAVAPASQNVDLGADPFKVDIAVSNVQNLGSYEFTLRFDPAVVEYLGVADKGFLRSTGRVQSCQTGTGLSEANSKGYARFGCNTNGLVGNDSGTLGPDGSAVLASVGFKPKGPGTSDLWFDGLEAGPQPTPAPGEVLVTELGKTGLSPVEDCNPGCGDELNINPEIQTGVIAVVDPNAGPTPTSVPATPTLTPRQPTRDIRATSEAVLGKPERTLDQATPLVPDRPNGATGSGGGDTSSGGVSGATTGGGRTGTTAGSSGGSGSSAGRTGAPIAGYGPQPQDRNPWPGRAGAGLLIIGSLAVATGFAARRRADTV
jgi:hypothetical protein